MSVITPSRFTPSIPPLLPDVSSLTTDQAPALSATTPDSPGGPPLGNFSGALAWPVPLAQPDQAAIQRLLQSTSTGLPGLPLADRDKGVLGYLLSGCSLTDADLGVTTRAIEQLLGSPKAQALGQAIQAELGGLPTDTSVNDYLMAAVHLGLDPELSQEANPNKIAGFDLAQPSHRGQRASVVVDGLSRHLIASGRASAQTARLAARLLLARTAPEFLVRETPASVTYGSLTWAQLAIATARIEADTPGRSLSMSYGEVLACAAQLHTRSSVLQAIQEKALTDWGVANGLLGSDALTDTELESVRVEYNRQLQALTTASSLAQTPIPSRRAMALAALTAAFPDLDPKLFDVKGMIGVFRVPGRAGRVDGPRSMLDIVMHGKKLGAQEHWESADRRLPASVFCQVYESGKLDIAETFKRQYDQAIAATEKGHQGLTRYLLSTLPAQDRKNLEYGALEFFHTNDYTMAMDLFSKPTLRTRGHTLRVKSTLGGEVNIYEIDTAKATIEKQNFWIRRYTPPYTDKNLHQTEANVISKTVLFNPFKDEQPDLAKAQASSSADQPKLGSARSDYIARVFAKSLDLGNDDVLRQARGLTSYDTQQASSQAVGEFFLNLIPLRSAIVNFSNGNVAEGLFDLSLDLIGLVTFGASKAAQAGKAFSKGITTLDGASKVARFIGAGAIAAFNPLGGVGDLAKGSVRLIGHGGRRLIAKGLDGVSRLRGASGSYDLLKAASKQHAEVAIGTFEVAGQAFEGAAVLRNGKWYGFDPDKLRGFGAELDNFKARARAVDGELVTVEVAPGRELSNALFSEFKVPDSTLARRTRNSQGVYVAADGHASHIRHIDSSGQAAVYEVREVSRTPEGVVQARIYSANRQTPLLVQHVQGDQWMRLGASGGNSPDVAADLGREIAGGSEGKLYESLDGKNVYKETRSAGHTKVPGYFERQVACLNEYYGAGFAVSMFEKGRGYIKMKKLPGVSLAQIPPRSLPPQARGALDEMLANLQQKELFHDDMQLSNFLYSAAENKVYPVDLSAPPRDVLHFDESTFAMHKDDFLRDAQKLRTQMRELIA